MPKLKSGTILPTPAKDAATTAAANINPDAKPFADVEWAQVKPLLSLGHPLGCGTNAQVNLRLDLPEVWGFAEPRPIV